MPRRCRWGRGSRRRTRSWWSTSSASRSTGFASSWATRIVARVLAAPVPRSLFTAGSAINHASETAVANGRDLAAEELEAAAADIEYAEGMFRIAGTDRGIGLFELAGQQPDRRIYVDATSSGERAELAERGAYRRGRGRSGDRGGRDRVLCVGQRCRPGGQSDDRARPARWRRGSGDRPGAGRAHAVRARTPAR